MPKKPSVASKTSRTGARAARGYLQALAEYANDGIFVHAGGKLLFANRRLSELLGYTPGELRQLTIEDILHPHEHKRMIARLQHHRNDPDAPQRHETRVRKKNGDTMPVEITAARTVWLERPAVIVIVRDITERKRTEHDLRRHTELLETIYANIHMLIAYMDPDFNYIRVNQAYADAAGTAPGFLVGKNHFALYPDAGHKRIFRRVVRTGVPYIAYAEPFWRSASTGDNRYWDWSVRPVKDPQGAVIGVVLTVVDVTERVLAEQARRESEEQMRLLLESTGEAIYGLDLDGNCTFANPACVRLLGYDNPAELLGRNMHALIHHTRRNGTPHPTEECRVYRAFRRGEGTHSDDEILWRKDGSSFHAETWSYPIRRGGRIVGAVVAFVDITQRRLAEVQMRKLSSALEQTADSVMVTDRDGVIEYVNPAFEQTTGFSREEALGRRPNLMKSGHHSAEFYARLWKTILAGKVFRDVIVNRKKDGTLYYEEKTITPLKDANGEITHFISTGKDITERMQVQERLHHLAYHDILTGLPNRALFMDRMEHALSRARRSGRLQAVLFLDLDNFKVINDTLGHDIGDQLLKDLSRRLEQHVRAEDTVARLGGDEFGILLEDLHETDDASLVARKLLNAIAEPFEIDARELYITMSIGISVCPNDGEDALTLIKNADAAMYRAKELGRNSYQFYSAEMGAKAFERLTLETSLRRALERNEFLLHYQPEVDLKTGCIVGVEALLRWQHPDMGLVSPADFIPVLEETGLIVPVGEWVLRSACAQVRSWRNAGLPQVCMCINLSGAQFNAPRLAETMAEIIKDTGLPPELLEFEITESVIMKNAQLATETLETLSAMGVKLAIDDFGTGYSSLSYLKRFPIDIIKIDMSFIRDVPDNPDDTAITAAIIAMAKSLKVRVVAEGVEKPRQLEFLRAHGCDSIQGFLFSPPLPADDVAQLIKEGRSLRQAVRQ